MYELNKTGSNQKNLFTNKQVAVGCNSSRTPFCENELLEEDG